LILSTAFQLLSPRCTVPTSLGPMRQDSATRKLPSPGPTPHVEFRLRRNCRRKPVVETGSASSRDCSASWLLSRLGHAHYYAPPENRRSTAAGATALAPDRRSGTSPSFASAASMTRAIRWPISMAYITSPPRPEFSRPRLGTVLSWRRAFSPPIARRRALVRDREVAIALRQGGSPVLEKLIAYFPALRFP